MPEVKCKNSKTCPAYNECRDSLASWIFLFIGLLATIAVRLVNLFLEFNPLWARIFWYTGIGGFFIYFLYKFRQDRNIQRELARRELSRKLSGDQEISLEDREFIKTILCKLKSSKDTINYFFIFLTSGLALILGIYLDFMR